jgi:hypothetical protein
MCTRGYRRNLNLLIKRFYALTMIKISGKSFREVALLSGIPTTLPYCAKPLKDLSNVSPNTKIKQSFHQLQVLSLTHEKKLQDYLIESQQRSHGLSPTKLKKLVYSFSIFNSIPFPASWVKSETAGKDWFTNFLKRNQRLSIQKFYCTFRLVKLFHREFPARVNI